MVDTGAAPRYEVLLVDDQEQVRSLVGAWLRGQGATVLIATTGEQAIELASACRVNVVLTDYELPGIGKVDLVAALREAQPQARIIVMSGGEVSGIDLERLRQAGMERFLAKPFGLQHLREAVLQGA